MQPAAQPSTSPYVYWGTANPAASWGSPYACAPGAYTSQPCALVAHHAPREPSADGQPGVKQHDTLMYNNQSFLGSLFSPWVAPSPFGPSGPDDHQMVQRSSSTPPTAAAAMAHVEAAEMEHLAVQSCHSHAALQRRSHDSPLGAEGRPPRHPLARLGGHSPLAASPSVDGLVHVAKAAEHSAKAADQSAKAAELHNQIAAAAAAAATHSRSHSSGRASPLSWFSPDLMGHHQVSSTTGMRASKSSLSLLSMRVDTPSHDGHSDTHSDKGSLLSKQFTHM